MYFPSSRCRFWHNRLRKRNGLQLRSTATQPQGVSTKERLYFCEMYTCAQPPGSTQIICATVARLSRGTLPARDSHARRVPAPANLREFQLPGVLLWHRVHPRREHAVLKLRCCRKSNLPHRETNHPQKSARSRGRILAEAPTKIAQGWPTIWANPVQFSLPDRPAARGTRRRLPSPAGAWPAPRTPATCAHVPMSYSPDQEAPRAEVSIVQQLCTAVYYSSCVVRLERPERPSELAYRVRTAPVRRVDAGIACDPHTQRHAPRLHEAARGSYD
jgi:hypothetical protein